MNCLIHGEPADLEVGDAQKMTEKDWELALEVFRASLPRRGDKWSRRPAGSDAKADAASVERV